MLFGRKSRRMKYNIRHFQNKTVDYAKYIKDFYLDSGLAFISCNVRGIDDVINHYSVKNYEDLNPDLAAYIEENAYHIPVEYPIVLELCGTTFTAEEQKMIEETIADYYSLKLGDTQVELRHNFANSLRLLVLGLACFVLYFIFERMNVLGETLDFAFWFFLWEFADMAWLTRMELLEEKTDAAQMASIKVVFKKAFKDDHEDASSANKIMAEIFDNPA